MQQPRVEFFRAPAIKQIPRPVDYLTIDVVDATRRSIKTNHLWQFFVKQIGEDATNVIFEKYMVGTSKHWPGATAFWQIDQENRPRQCKVMLYNAETGRRVKHDGKDFIAFMGKKILGPDANLQQCLFGCHLLPVNPSSPVAIVESEKTALYCAHFYPNYVWLATGGKQGCSWQNKAAIEPLKGRTVVLFPDLKATDDWKAKAEKVRAMVNCKIHVSEDLERDATDDQKANGWDLMDFLLLEQRECGPQSSPESKDDVAAKKPTANSLKRKYTNSWDIDTIHRDLAAIQIPDGLVRICKSGIISNPALFIETSLQRLEANNGNPTFAPTYERIMQFIDLCKQQTLTNGIN